jgi:hypothetical protein
MNEITRRPKEKTVVNPTIIMFAKAILSMEFPHVIH